MLKHDLANALAESGVPPVSARRILNTISEDMSDAEMVARLEEEAPKNGVEIPKLVKDLCQRALNPPEPAADEPAEEAAADEGAGAPEPEGEPEEAAEGEAEGVESQPETPETEADPANPNA